MSQQSHVAMHLGTRYARLPLFFLFFLVGTSFLRAQETIVEDGTTVHDSELNREGEEGFKEARERWLKEMHRADPGVNVRVLNEETRRSKQALREKNGTTVLGADGWVSVAGTLGGYWSERGSNNQAGRTLAADIDYKGGKIYVAADGGQIWRGTFQGTEWTSLNDNNRFGGVRMLRVLHTDQIFRIIAVYGSHVAYSDDDGQTWQQATGLDDIQRSGGFSRGVITDSYSIVYALGNEWNFGDPWRSFAVLYRSDDFGTSFTRVRTFDTDPNLMDIWNPPGEDWIYLLHDDTLSQVMADGTIQPFHVGIELENGMSGISQLNLRGSDPKTLYLLAQRNGVNEVHGSPDAGASWIHTGSTTSLFDRNSFAVSPNDPNFLVAGGIETLYSRDAGVTWDTVNKWAEYYGRPVDRLHADIPFIQFFRDPDNSTTILISTDGGLYRSDNGLASVQNLALSGLGIGQYYSVYTSRVDTQFIFAGSQDQGFQRVKSNQQGPLPFVQTISGDYGHITSGDNGRSLWTNYPGFSMYYPNALASELPSRSRKTLNFPTKGHLWLPPIVADPDMPTVAYLAGGDVGIGGTRLVRLSYDVGSSEITATHYLQDFSEGRPNVPITAVAISPLQTDNWYVVTSESRFFVSTNRGKTWRETEDFAAPLGHYFYGASIVPSAGTPGLLYVSGAGYSNPPVWVSRDNGRTFTSLSDGLPPTLVYDIAASQDDRMLFAATEAGPYMYLADSGAWYDIAGSSAPDQIYWSVDYIDANNVARFGTYGRGIWDFRIADVPSSVAADPARASSPLSLASQQLGGNATAFTLENPETADVTLRVYDLTGRAVSILHQGSLSAGTHRFVWNGVASGGGPVPSGEYFCVAAASGTVAYAKTIVER